ncbi:MAG: right-handed parallel beta-helix repeat-containing protein [Myxococcota bacterium]
MPITTAQELRDALRAAQPGDTLTLAPGIYALPTALACDRDLTLTGDAHLGLHTTGPLIHHTAGRLTLNGLTFSRSGPGHGPLIESSGGQIRLDQCRLRGNPTHINRDSTGVHLSRLAWLVGTQSHVEGFGVGVRLEDDARAELADWTLVRNHYGLKLHAHSQGNLDRCTIGRSTSDGIAVSGEAVARLRHNRCTSNNHSAIAFRGRSSGLVVGNSCVRGMWGIHVGGHASPVLRNNTCAHNRMSGIHYSGHAGGVARGNTCHRNKVGLEVEGHASPALHDNQIVDNDTDPTTALTSSTRQLPAPHSTTVPAHAPRHLQHLPTPPASTIATIAVLAATTLAILLPSLGWALIGMATAWAIYIALGLGHWFGLSWLMRHGRTQRANTTATSSKGASPSPGRTPGAIPRCAPCVLATARPQRTTPKARRSI